MGESTHPHGGRSVPITQVLLRKGGIDESGFKIEANNFLLFPSFFHADPALLKPG